jgi:hypothetical protein
MLSRSVNWKESRILILLLREEAQKYYDDEQRIMKTGVPIIDQIQKETRRDGSIEYNYHIKISFS